MMVELIYGPEEREMLLLKRCTWITNGIKDIPKEQPTTNLISGLLRARHSPIRVLNYAFYISDIPSNTATHLARHVHAQPFISSLRNDRQSLIDGDKAPRDTPVNMILYTNAEELQVIANKRLCKKASENTRKAVELICAAAINRTPELLDVLVPMCEHCGGVCHEISGCGKCCK